jgi:uncharacterized Tic20 family protein
MTDIPPPPGSGEHPAGETVPPVTAPPPTASYAAPLTPGAPGGTLSEKDAKLWGMLCHLAALAGFIIPLGTVIGPLIIWLIKKNDSPFVDDQGKESLNFQITVLIAAVVSVILMIILIGFFLLIAVGLTDLIFIIIASVKANNGEQYRYPFAIRFIK